MSHQAANHVEKIVCGITRSEKYVLESLAKRHDTRTGVATVSISVLARSRMLTERRIYMILASLDQNKFIERISGGGRSLASQYRFPGLENPEANFTVSRQETLKFGALNPEICDTKPCNPRPETLKPASGAIRKEVKASKSNRGKEQNQPPPPQPKSEFSQADFDERDLRLLRKARELEYRPDGELKQWAQGYSRRQLFEWECMEAGITVRRGLELEEHQKKWPEKVPPEWAQEESSERKEIKNAS